MVALEPGVGFSVPETRRTSCDVLILVEQSAELAEERVEDQVQEVQ